LDLFPRDCPIINVVSPQAWKHWGVGALGLVLGLVLLIAGETHSQWAKNLGPGIPRMLKVSASPIVIWTNTLTLFLAAQASLVVLWARSHSLKDVDGRYRIWGWAAATWIVLSLSVATQVHLAWSETVLHFFPWRASGAALWCWLVPASIWGLGLSLRLEQDMREDRAGYWVFMLAGVWHLVAVGLICQREFSPQYLNLPLNQLILGAVQITASSTLFLSMSLHARYVLYFCAEPPSGKRRNGQARKSFNQATGGTLIQRLLPNWMTGVKMPQDVVETDTDDEDSTTGRKRAAPKKRSTARKTPRRSKTTAIVEGDPDQMAPQAIPDTPTAVQLPEAGATGKKVYRVDKPLKGS
jgi:hypothetical protein